MADTTIRAVIKLLVEGGHIPKEVAAQIKGVGTESKKAKAELGGLGQAGKDLGGILAQYVGAAALGGFIKSSVVAFADLDRQFSSLGRAMTRIGLDGTADLSRARTELSALALSGGPLQSQTIPAMQKFVTMTRDIDKALAAVKLASDISESGITDFGTAASGVASLLQGRVKVAATQFGIDLTDLNGKAKSNADLIREIEKVYGGLGDAFDDAANQIDTLAAQWEKLKQTVGGSFAPALGAINGALFHTIGAAKDLGEVWGLVFNGMAAMLHNLGAKLGAAFDFKTLFTAPSKYAENLKQAFTENAAAMGDAWKTFTDGVASNHTTAAAKVGDTTKGLAALIQQATKATAEEDAKAAAEAAQKRLDIEHKVAQDSLKAQIDAAKDGSAERLSLEMDLLDEMERAAIESAAATGASVDKIRSSFELQRLVKGREFAKAASDEDFAAVTASMEATADLIEEGSQARLAAELALLDRKKFRELESFKGTQDGKDAIEAEYFSRRTAMLADYLTSASTTELNNAQMVAEAIQEAADTELQLRIAQGVAQSEAEFELRQEQLDRKYAADKKALDRERRLAIENSKTTHIAIAQIESFYKAKSQALDNNYTKATVQTAQQARDGKIAAAEQYVGAAAALGNAAFGHSKALMVAEAIAATALAVVKSLPNYVLAAIVAATGAIQVANILRATPGTGAGAGAGMGSSTPVPANAESPTQAAVVPVTAADGTIVPASASMPGHPGKAKGTDTVPAWLAPGEIVTPSGASAEVLSGASVLMAPSVVPRGVRSEKIIGGKIAVVRTRNVSDAEPTPPPATGGDATEKWFVAKIATVKGPMRRRYEEILERYRESRPRGAKVLHASRGEAVPDDRGEPRRPSSPAANPGGVKSMISRAAEWFRTAAQPVPDIAAPQIARSTRPAIMIGGAKFSSALMPQLGGSSFVATSSAAVRPPSDPGLARIANKLDEIKVATEAAASAEPGPTNITNTVTIGTAYGDRRAMTKLAREINRVNANNQGDLR